MSGETPNNNNQSPAVTEWDSLKNYDVIEQNLQDELLNIDDMLKSGSITEEKADKYRAEINAKLKEVKEPHLDPSSQKYFDDENLNIDDMLKSGSITEEQAERFREEVKQRAQQSAADDLELQKKLQQMEQRGGEDEFSGERNINDATGKERTRGLFDLYPQGKGRGGKESHQEYVDRLHHMRELTDRAEKEKISALENEKEAVLAGEAEDTNAQETEQLSVAEAERRKAEYQEMLERIEALQGENKGESKVDRKESLEEKKAELEKKRSELAELYAKNRRLFVGKANKEKFKEAKAEYNEMLDEYLKLQAEDSYESGKNKLSNQLKNRFDTLKESIESQLAEFAGGELENTDKTPEEIEAERARLLKTAAEALKQEWKERTGQLETDINAEFVENFLKEENALEDATIDRLDNGTIFRKAISKVLANKYLKGALVGAAIVGLAVTGIGLGMGLAAGTASIGYGLTLGGAVAGAGRGAFMGALMSRQDSKNSAVREFASEEDIRNQLKGINVLDENSGAANVTNWLLNQYETAKDTDLSSNRKRTAISAGLGAAFGALLSGVQINQVTAQPNVEPEQIGTTPIEYQYQAANLDNVNIPEGHGISTTFQQLGGDLNDPAAFDQFTNIVHDIGNNYGLVPGDNGMVGAFAHTYPGTIDTWPADAQAYITDVANEAARQGLIPANTTVIGGGEPIYDTVERVASGIVPDAFMNFLAQATATAGIGAGAGLFAGRENRMPESSTPATPNSEPRTPEPTPEITEAEPTPVEEETPPQEPEVSPQEPETTPETSEGNSEAQATEQSPQPESAPSPQEQALDENARMLTKNELRNLTIQAGINDFDDESIDIITLPATANEQSTNQQRIETWWEGLDDAHKEIVREYVSRQNSSNIYGSALRLFLAQEDRLRAENTPNNAV